jgi:hypothetical protein
MITAPLRATSKTHVLEDGRELDHQDAFAQDDNIYKLAELTIQYVGEIPVQQWKYDNLLHNVVLS